MDPVARVLDAMTAAGWEPREARPGAWVFRVRIGGRQDRRPSGAMRVGQDGRVLLFDHAGTPLAEMLDALGLRPADLFPPAPQRPGTAPRKPNPDAPPAPDFAPLVEEFRLRPGDSELDALSSELGVPAEAIDELAPLWVPGDRVAQLVARSAATEPAWGLPMRDTGGRVIGLQFRRPGGAKFSARGSRLGLFVPARFRARPGEVLIVEGASDAAACTAAGLPAVGRASATHGADLLAELLADVPEVIVVGENDARPGRWPGRDGAVKLARDLARAWGRPVRWALPPRQFKDLRAWFNEQRQETRG